MGFTHTVWAWEQTDLSYAEKYALLALADHAPEVGKKDAGKCWASVPNLAEKMGYSRGSRRTVREAIRGLEGKGKVRVTGRKRPGTEEQTTHLYTLLMPKGYVIREKDDPSEVGANSTDVGAISTGGRGYQPHEYTSEPTNEPTTLPTPSPLRDDEEKIPSAIDVPSTAHEISSREDDIEATHTSKLRALAKNIYYSSTEPEYDKATEDFINTFENIYGSSGRYDAGHMLINNRYDDRLTELVHEAQRTRGEERGLSYGVAQWLGIFTNAFNA